MVAIFGILWIILAANAPVPAFIIAVIICGIAGEG
jgi:hypothetical protein